MTGTTLSWEVHLRCCTILTRLCFSLEIGRRRGFSSVLLLQIIDLKAYGISIPCRPRKKMQKALYFWKCEARILDVLAARDRVSYFE